MTLGIVSEIISVSKNPLVLVKGNGDLVSYSKEFQSLISSNIPFKKNLFEMLLAVGYISVELFEMYRSKQIKSSLFPVDYKVVSKFSAKIFYIKGFEFESENYHLIEFKKKVSVDQDVVNFIINSDSLFINFRTASIIFSAESNSVIAINAEAKKIRKLYFQDNPETIKDFEEALDRLIAKAKIGGLSTDIYTFDLNSSKIYLELNASLILKDYYQIFVNDISASKRQDQLLIIEKQRINQLSSVVPGIIFEFELRNNDFKFNFVSEGIKDLIGYSSDVVINDSNVLFSRIDKLQRAKLHYLFNYSSEEQRRLKNEFKIKDSNNQEKHVTIDWQMEYVFDSYYKGSGYISDITDKKNAQLQKEKADRIKYYKEYFSLVLLRSNKKELIFFNLAKAVVNKLNLENCVIYKFDFTNNVFEHGGSYVNSINLKVKQDYQNLPNNFPQIFEESLQSFSMVERNNLDKSIYFQTDKVRSEIALPIMFEGELLGLIYSSSNVNNFFTEEHKEVLNDIALSLSWRITHNNRIKMDAVYKSSLSSLFDKGKIFEFKYYVNKGEMSNDTIENFISLLELEDSSLRLEIYQNRAKVFEYFTNNDFESTLKSDLSEIQDSLKNIVYSINTSNGKIKYIKVSLTNISKTPMGIDKLFGTIQDITETVNLQNRKRSFERQMEIIHNITFNNGYNKKNALDELNSSFNLSHCSILNLNDKKVNSSESILQESELFFDCINYLSNSVENQKGFYFNHTYLSLKNRQQLRERNLNSVFFIFDNQIGDAKKCLILADSCATREFDHIDIKYFKNLLNLLQIRENVQII